MGGRIAEEMFMHHITTGAGNDIERATDMARKMVCEWGMSELGPMSFGKKEEQIFLGREIAQHRDYSEVDRHRDRRAGRKLVDGGYNDAQARSSAERSEAHEAHRRGAAGARSSGWRRSEGADRRTAAAAADRIRRTRTITKGHRCFGPMAACVCPALEGGSPQPA